MLNTIKDYFRCQLENLCPFFTIKRIHETCKRNVPDLQATLSFDLLFEERKQQYNYHLRTEICKCVITGVATYMFRDVFAAVFKSLNISQYLGTICEYIDGVTIDRILTELVGF